MMWLSFLQLTFVLTIAIFLQQHHVMGWPIGNIDIELVVGLQTQEYAFLQNLYSTLGLFPTNTNSTSNTTFPATTSTDGNSTSSVCSWQGITCDHNGLVIFLDLSSLAMEAMSTTTQGTQGPLLALPWDWRPLSVLQRLLLRNNNFDGPLPTHLPSTLIHFNVDRNRFHGTIPTQWKDLVLMERLILSGNMLEGQLLTPLCFMVPLKALNVARNRDMTGQVPECLASLNQLTSLDVTGTTVTGPLPQALLRRCEDLVQPSNDDGKTIAMPRIAQAGYCQRFDFCLDGYYRPLVSDSRGTICTSCSEPSNILASPTCEWIVNMEEPPSPPPLATSEFPTTQPTTRSTMLPSQRLNTIAPWPEPTWIPSTSPTVTITFSPSTTRPSASLTRAPSTHRPSSFSSFSPERPANNGDVDPTTVPSVTPSVEFPSRPSLSPVLSVESESPVTKFIDGPIFVPLWVTCSVISVVSWFVILPVMTLWLRRKERQGYRSSNSINSNTSGDSRLKPDEKKSHTTDDELKRPDGRNYFDDDDHDEIVFTTEEIGADLMVETGLEPLFSDYEADFGLSTDDIPSRSPSNAKPSETPRKHLEVESETWMRNSKVRFTLSTSRKNDTTMDDVFPSLSGVLSHDDAYEGMVVLGHSSSSLSSTTAALLNPLESPMSAMSSPSKRQCRDICSQSFCFRPPKYYYQTSSQDVRPVVRIASSPAVLGIRSPFFDSEEYGPVDSHEQKTG